MDDGKRVRAPTAASHLCLRFASCKGVGSGGGNGRGRRQILAWRILFFTFFGYFLAPFFCLIFGRVFRLILGAFGVHFGSHFRCFFHSKNASFFLSVLGWFFEGF